MPTTEENEARIIILEEAVLYLQSTILEMDKQIVIRDAQLNQVTSQLLDTRNRIAKLRVEAGLDVTPPPSPDTPSP